MRYFLDTEFIEGFHKPLFGKSRHFIDLISIGIVDDHGNEFYSISSEYDYEKADVWVKENVIMPLYRETVHGDQRNLHEPNNFHKFFGRTNKEIMCDIILWMYNNEYQHWLDSTAEFIERGIKFGWGGDVNHEFYAYYADYDWVLFCSLFGRMIDLPHGFPMYCRDLKQMLDERLAKKHIEDYTDIPLPAYAGKQLKTLEEKLAYIKAQPDYPKQDNEHSALDDAKWNKKLFKFIQKI